MEGFQIKNQDLVTVPIREGIEFALYLSRHGIKVRSITNELVSHQATIFIAKTLRHTVQFHYRNFTQNHIASRLETIIDNHGN